MKHIFTVHSLITLFITLAIIDYKEIEENDIIILTRGYRVPIDEYHASKCYSDCKKNTFSKVFSLNAPKAIDKYINTYLDNDIYELYVDLMTYENQVLATNEKCIKFNFIEEGVPSYEYYDTLESLSINNSRETFRLSGLKDLRQYNKTIIRAVRAYNNRISSLPFGLGGYSFFKNVDFFGFSTETFTRARINNKHVLNFNKKYLL